MVGGTVAGDVEPVAASEPKTNAPFWADEAWWTREVPPFEQYWDKEITPHGRRLLMEAAGVKLPAAVRWHHVSEENRAKIQAAIADGKGATAEQAATDAASAKAGADGRADTKAFRDLKKASPVFKKLVGDTHPESSAAVQYLYGWRDAEKGVPLTAARGKYVPDPSVVHDSYNPIDPYRSAYFSQQTGEHIPLRARDDDIDVANFDNILTKDGYVRGGDFGPIHDQYRHDAKAAVARLIADQTGEATAALHHPAVGDIDLVWGDAPTDGSEGMGLAKIAAKHPEVLNDLQGFISRLTKDEKASGKNRVRLQDATGQAVVRLDWDGRQKTWLLTAFEKDGAGSDTRTDIATSTLADDTASRETGADTNISPTPAPGKTSAKRRSTESSESSRAITAANETTALDAAKEPAESAEPPAAKTPKNNSDTAQERGYGARNTLVTAERADELRARLKAKLKGQLNSGIDPEVMAIGTELAAFHIEAGARSFVDFAKAMAADLDTTVEKIKPYLRAWYNGARDMTEDAGRDISGTDGPDAVRAAMADIGKIDSNPAPVKVPADKGPASDDRGRGDDAGRDAAGDDQSLDDALPSGSEQAREGGGDPSVEGLRPSDPEGDGQSGPDRSGRGDGLDGGAKPLLHRSPAEVRPLADGPVGHTEDRPNALAGDNPGNFEITDDLGLGEGTDGEKIEKNLAALRTLRALQEANRLPTPDEQATMARYVGWGGLKTVFDPRKAQATDRYGRAQRELRELLTADEFKDANASIRNAHYTAKGVVDGMWRVAAHMGFRGGLALEPTVGIGNFIGLQPASMAASTQWHASEIDTVTGAMAALIYPEANILAATGFQDAPFRDGVFDLAIGNPPFGSENVRDKDPRRKHLSGMKIHNYVIAKTGMHLRPGGVMAMVVTHRFLDTANPEARDVLAKDFRFVGAFRLPNNAFAANAGTEVVTDVIFLQKLDASEKRDRNAAWLDVDGAIDGEKGPIRVNRYYQENPTHILGRSAMDGTMYGGRRDADGEGEYTVHGDGRDIGKAIDELLVTGGLAAAKNILVPSASAINAEAVMLEQSDQPIRSLRLGADGKIIRREMDDANGNAVLTEVTQDALWKDQAAEWMAFRDTILDIKKAAATRRLTADDVEEVIPLSRFTYKADGERKSDPSKAEQAVYDLVDALARPERFEWDHEPQLDQIESALRRKQLGIDGYHALRGMLDLRNKTLRLVHAEVSDDPKMERYRAELNEAYDAFVAANGFLSDPKNANLLDGDIGAEAGLESSFKEAISAAVSKSQGVPQRKASATKADILKTRVNFPYKEITFADNSADALSISMSEKGRVDLPYMAKIAGKDVKEVIADLTSGESPQLFFDPETGEYQEADRYLSGNVKHKLDVARENGIESNIVALEAVQPAPKTKAQITPNIRGMWMPTEIFSDFITQLGGKRVTITAIPSQGILSASAEGIALSDFGIPFKHDDRSIIDIFNAAASGKPITITRSDGHGKTFKDDEATKAVNALTDRMAKVFQEWAYSEEDRADKIVAAFNEKMNTHIPRKFDGVKYLKTVGNSPSIKLRRTQKNAAWRMMQDRTVLLDHVVGAGKTFTLITGIMERRRLGLSRKPAIAVPNHLVTQWTRDFYKLYPGAKILSASPADFAKKNRRRLLARIATGDFDAIVVGHTSLGFMETPADDLKTIMDEKVDSLKRALDEARNDKSSKRTLGQIQSRLEKYETKLADLAERYVDEIGMDFKALGIDYLAVDEAHEFKNLEYATSGERVVGMNDPAGSKRAFDLYSKVRGLLERSGGVAFATGTPVSNSLVEIYTMMSYLAHDELVLRQQEHFDAWSGAYAATETRNEYTATQKLKPRRVLAGLHNLSALRQLYEQFADIITMRDLKRIYSEEMAEQNKTNGTDLRTDFPVPKVMHGGRSLIANDITDSQREYMDYLVARMDAIERNKSDKEYMSIDNALFVMTDARKMSLDIRVRWRSAMKTARSCRPLVGSRRSTTNGTRIAAHSSYSATSRRRQRLP